MADKNINQLIGAIKTADTPSSVTNEMVGDVLEELAAGKEEMLQVIDDCMVTVNVERGDRQAADQAIRAELELAKIHPVEVEDAEGADLVLADGDGHDIVTFADGHVRTANFDSAEMSGRVEENGQGIAAINGKIGAANGIAPLGEDGKVPMGNIPETILYSSTYYSTVSVNDLDTFDGYLGRMAAVTDTNSTTAGWVMVINCQSYQTQVFYTHLRLDNSGNLIIDGTHEEDGYFVYKRTKFRTQAWGAWSVVGGDEVMERLGQLADAVELASVHPVEVDDAPFDDFVIANEDGDPILTVNGGHVQTSNFNSADIFTAEDLPIRAEADPWADLSLADEDGNVIAEFADGHIRTANFDSSSFEIPDLSELRHRPYQGKRLSIIGDSISTFSGYLPGGYESFYPHGDITDVNKTWWRQVLESTGMELLRNCSWSGSTLTGNSADTSGWPACGSGRVSHLSDGSLVPDVVVVYIGINDFANLNRGVGSWTSHSALPTDGNITDISTAYAKLLCKIRTAYPSAQIYCCTILDYGNSWPLVNGASASIQDYNEAIRKVAETMGATVVDVHGCGISYYNLGTYTIDGVHPNAAGAELIANKISQTINNN